MKWIFYLIALASALFAPVKRTDVGKLQPVQVVYVNAAENVVIETDTGDIGVGDTIRNAVENLVQTTPGVIYLDTAEFLLVNESAVSMTQELLSILEPGVKVCFLEGDADLAAAAKYLSVHPPETKLKDWNGEDEMQILKEEDGVLSLENN